jgi:ankyrin repeat protein
MMDKFLSGYLLTRKIGNENIRITSLGSPKVSDEIIDNWGRKWMTSRFTIPFADMEILFYAMPTPTGIIGLFALIPTSRVFPYILDFNEMINNITFSYEASLEEWEIFLSAEEILPDFLSSTSFQFEPGKEFRWINDRVSLQFDSSLLGITPQSRLHINPYFIQNKDEIIWNINNIYYYENESKRSYVSLERVFPPLSPMDTKVLEKWDSLHSAKYPYTGNLIISKERSYMFEKMNPPGSGNNKEELNSSWSVGLCIDSELDSREMNGRFRHLMNGFTLLPPESEAASFGFNSYVNQELTRIENSTIFQAISNNNIELVKKFIADRIDLNKVNYEGRTPFMLAARLEKEEIARHLLNSEIDLNPIDNYGHTSLHLSLRYLPEDISLKIISEGIHIDTIDQDGYSPLMVAAKQELDSAAQLLINMGVNFKNKNNAGKNALYYSCYYGMDDLSMRLIKNGSPTDGAHSNGYNTLMAAFEHSSPEIVDLLIENGVSLNEVTDSGWSTLHGALRFGHKEAARIIFHESTYLETKTKDNWTPLHLAVRYGNREIALALIEKGVDLNVPNENKWTPLHLALRYDQNEIATAIIENGADKNVLNNSNWTPLHFATRYNQPENAKLLIENGALLDIQNDEGYTALHLALRNEQPETAALLIDKGADVNIQNSIGWSAIHYALRYSTKEISKTILEQNCNLSAKTSNNWTPLLFAIRYKDAELARDIIRKNGDITTVNKDGTNAIMLASKFNPTVLIDLLETSILINAQNNEGKTALHYAIEGENKGAFYALLQRGADLRLKDNNGKSAEDILKEKDIKDWL